MSVYRRKNSKAMTEARREAREKTAEPKIIARADVREPMILAASGRSNLPAFAPDYRVVCGIGDFVIVKGSPDPIETRRYLVLAHLRSATGWAIVREGLTDFETAMAEAVKLASAPAVGKRRGLGQVPAQSELRLPDGPGSVPVTNYRRAVVVPTDLK